MPSQKNIDQLKQIQTKLEQSKSVVLADYRGLSVNQLGQLRQQIKAVKGELLVTKNTLLKLALKAEKYPLSKGIEAILQGPTMTLFAYEEAIAPIKVLYQFSQENSLPEIKAGFLTKEALSVDQVKQLAQLPNKPELICQAISGFRAPLSGFVNVLANNLRKLVYVLKEVKLHG
jgi:large subunit ribosomal protein L10